MKTVLFILQAGIRLQPLQGVTSRFLWCSISVQGRLNHKNRQRLTRFLMVFWKTWLFLASSCSVCSASCPFLFISAFSFSNAWFLPTISSTCTYEKPFCCSIRSQSAVCPPLQPPTPPNPPPPFTPSPWYLNRVYGMHLGTQRRKLCISLRCHLLQQWGQWGHLALLGLLQLFLVNCLFPIKHTLGRMASTQSHCR